VRFLTNPLRKTGLAIEDGLADGNICIDPTQAVDLFGKCPVAQGTPLTSLPALAERFGVGEVWAKDERGRMGLGSFKALGAAHAIAKMAISSNAGKSEKDLSIVLEGTTFVCASAGNHGLSVAAGARIFGARAVVYLSMKVPDAFADRLRAFGAQVARAGDDYEASLRAALAAAEEHGWNLLSDSSWEGYSAPAQDVMEGYLIMGAEIADQMAEPPTHIFLQAGVGGLAAACAASARNTWGNEVKIFVVEPEYAPALINSIEAGEPVVAPGPASNMGRLDCKEPSHLALKYLAREIDGFLTVSDDQVLETMELLAAHGMESTPSGVAGLAGLQWIGLHFDGQGAAVIGLGASSRVLVYISEGPERAGA